MAELFARVDVPADTIREARAVLGRAAAAGAPRVDDAVLMASELLTNAALHGRPPIDLVISLGDEELVVAVVDAGPGPDLVVLDAAGRGRGLELVDRLADEWGVHHAAGGTAVWFRLRREGAPPPPSRG